MSPYSFQQALALLHQGAAGETKSEIRQLLLPNNCSDEQLNQFFASLNHQLTHLPSDKGVALSLANSLWSDNDCPIRERYRQQCRAYYSATAKSVSFQHPSTLSIINRWASEHTQGRVPEILSELPKGTQLMLMNAAWFKAAWLHPFDAALTQKDSFYVADGKVSVVDMMHQTEELDYYDCSAYACLSLPLSEGLFSMNLVLPAVGVSDSQLGKALLQNISKDSSLFKSLRVQLTMPKFALDGECSLVETCRRQGMRKAFCGEADFSEMSSHPLYIDLFKQNVFLSVDESGMEAAAVTVVGMMKMAFRPEPSIEFCLNRPFFFYVQDNRNGVVLFIGKMASL